MGSDTPVEYCLEDLPADWVEDCSDAEPFCFENDTDECGICSSDDNIPDDYNHGDGPDCADVCFGSAFDDDCGVCSGGSSFHEPNSDKDCAGECFGDSDFDDCDLCVAPEDWNWAQDCAGECFGEAIVDDCDDCVDPQDFNEAQDCLGVCDGDAYIDDCGVCDGLDSDMDCNGDCFGSAFIDSCDQCVEGETGDDENWAFDCAGVCFGPNEVDDCGVCDDNPENDGADDLGCGCFEPAPLTYYFDSDQDGLGAGEGLLFCLDEVPEGWVDNNDDTEPNCATNDTDDCGLCGGGNAAMDCNGICFGYALEDDCGICDDNPDNDGETCHSPFANDQSVLTDEDECVTFDLDAFDPDNDDLQVISLFDPAVQNGTLTDDGELSFTYCPSYQFSGSDEFIYYVSDGTYSSSTATVSFTVTEVDDPPVAALLGMDGTEDNSIMVILAATDIDTDDGNLSFENISTPSNGELNFGRALAILDYIPNPDFCGDDSFTYQAFDGNSYSEEATITLNVACVNDAPVIVSVMPVDSDVMELDENTSLDFTVELFDVENDPLTLDFQGELHGDITGDFPDYTYTPHPGWSGIVFVALIAIMLISFCSFVYDNKGSFKSIVTLKGIDFEPVQLVLLAPIIVCFANIIVQNGSQPRYLFPLFGMTTIWIGIFTDKIKKKYKWLPITVLMIWISFYSFTNYINFQKIGVIKGNKVVKLEKHIIHDLVDFLEKKKIIAAYSDINISMIGSYYSGGKINICEFSSKPVFNSLSGSILLKRKREKANASTNFAIIAKNNHAITYQDYLQKKRITYKSAIILDYEIFWDFSGNDIEINNLRTLIS